MKQVGNMKLYSLEEVTDEIIGKKETPERDDFDRKVEDVLHAYRIGEAIRNARQESVSECKRLKYPAWKEGTA